MKNSGHSGAAWGALHSVFVRCAGLMAATTIVVAGVMSWQSARLSMDLARQGVASQLTKSTQSTAEALVKPIRFKAVPKMVEAVDTAMSVAGALGEGAIVLGLEAVPMAQSGLDRAPELRDRLSALAERAMQEATPLTAQGGLWRAEPVFATPGGDVIGAVAVAFTAEASLAPVRAQNLWIGATALGLFAVMAVVSTLLLRRTLGHPMRQITSAIRQVADGDYESRIALTTRRDEFGSMAESLERLVERLCANRSAEELRARQHEEQGHMVDALSNALDWLAKGVLNREVTTAFPPEHERLRENFNRTVAALRAAIMQVRDSASNINASTSEISRASDDLSRRTETQAATLEQSAAALEEMLGSVNAAAQHAKDVDGKVRNTREIAHQNGEVMQKAVQAMGQIEKSSEQISDIITVIDDIAFQTNLLALNAGVEAARAGESGKGFAVVASEVRGLAQRSAEAAQQIKDLIIGSSDHVRHGVDLVEQAGNALHEMVSRVSEISGMVTHIAQGTVEQARALEEINLGVSNLDQVTQKNAAMVEEATAAAQMLSTDARGMIEQVAIFQTGSDINTGFESPEPVPESHPEKQIRKVG